MAFGFIKSTQGAGSSVTSLAITIPAVPVNTLVIVNIKFITVVSVGLAVTDNASTPNTYAKAVGPITNGSSTMYQFYGVAVVGGATSVTISWTGAASLRATIDEFSGGMQTNASVFDKAASNTGIGTAGSVTIAPTSAGGLVVGAIGFAAAPTAITAGANYIIGTNNNSTSTLYRQVSTTSETVPITWTTSETWAQVAGSYIPLPMTTQFFKMF